MIDDDDDGRYRFDGVFGERSTNAQIFEHAVKPMVDYLFNTRGGHGTCFAYGQTGSGKTVTMEGLGHGSPSQGNVAGMYQYVAHELFDRVHAAKKHGSELVVRAGFFEIYRGKCFDLLARKRKIEVRSSITNLEATFSPRVSHDDDASRRRRR